jgi:hypothetical protein
MRLTPAKIRRNATKVRITKIRAYMDADEKGPHKYCTCNAKALDGIRTVTMRLYGKMDEDGTMSPNNPVWVHCSCPYFKYYLEVALAARGSASILSSNGRYPKIRNPGMKPFLCKHAFLAGPILAAAKAKRRKITQIDDMDLEQLVKLLEPFIPKK